MNCKNWCFRAVNLEVLDKYVQHLVDFGIKNVFGKQEHSLNLRNVEHSSWAVETSESDSTIL